MKEIKGEWGLIKYQDRGQGEVIVFVHGTPTNSSEYQSVIKKLESQFRCVAIDHLGFGQSEKPVDGDYSLSAHRARLKAMLQKENITEFHLVVHDFGGVIGLPLIHDHQYRIKSVTILNSWFWPLIQTEPQMKQQVWLVRTGLLPFLYRYFNLSARMLIKMAWGQKVPLSRHRHQELMRQFKNSKQREGTIGFLKALFDFNSPEWQRLEEIEKLKHMPVQIIWGQADRLISMRNLEKWISLLPQAEVVKYSDVGHFVAEEAPVEVASRIETWVQKNQ